MIARVLQSRYVQNKGIRMAWAAATSDMQHLGVQVASLLAGHFRMALSRGLAAAARRWASGGAAEEADRLAPIVEALSQRRVLQTGVAPAGPRRRGQVSESVLVCPVSCPHMTN